MISVVFKQIANNDFMNWNIADVSFVTEHSTVPVPSKSTTFLLLGLACCSLLVIRRRF